MVSTRGPKSRYFEKGEKVLCYEPDPSKAKVLYDSKILGTYESKDKRGRKIIQYKIHFQGWSSSWDRKVSADYVLKDTDENRQLQRDLAEKAQLQLGAYLYRKEHKNKKRSRKSAAVNSEDSADASASSPNKLRPRGLSEDNFSSGSTFEKQDHYSMKDGDCDSDSCCSSVESFHDEDRVMLRLSERLRQYLEYDHDMIVQYGKQHTLPSRMPVVAILESFVKQTALKMVFTSSQTEAPPRRRTTTPRATEKKEKDVDKIISTVDLLKEVADGLRIYFDFTISDYLLYTEEREYAMSHLTEDNLKNFTYVPTPAFSLEWFNVKSNDTSETISNCNANTSTTTTSMTPTLLGSDNTMDMPAGAGVVYNQSTMAETTNSNNNALQEEQPQRRKLRSHRNIDDDFCEITLENCLSSIASTNSGASTPMNSNIPMAQLNCLKSLAPISPQIRDFLQNVLSWRILPSNANVAASMIFGAPHLARLIVKLPEFLNASAMSDEKLKTLLQHLDTFINYLESHKEWFNEDNYARKLSSKYTSVVSCESTSTTTLTSTTTAITTPTPTSIPPQPEVKKDEEETAECVNAEIDENLNQTSTTLNSPPSLVTTAALGAVAS